MEPRSLEEGGLLPPPSMSHSSAGEERRPGHPKACHQKETVDSLMYVSEDILLTDVAVYFIVCELTGGLLYRWFCSLAFLLTCCVHLRPFGQ